MKEKIRHNPFDLPYETMLLLMTNDQKKQHFIDQITQQYADVLQKQNIDKDVDMDHVLQDYQQSLFAMFDGLLQHHFSILALENSLQLLKEKEEEQKQLLQDLEQEREQAYALWEKNNAQLKHLATQ